MSTEKKASFPASFHEKVQRKLEPDIQRTFARPETENMMSRMAGNLRIRFMKCKDLEYSILPICRMFILLRSSLLICRRAVDNVRVQLLRCSQDVVLLGPGEAPALQRGVP